MSAVTGTFRNGKIELHGPPPPDWVDGTEVSVYPREPAGDMDFTDDNVDFCLPPGPKIWSSPAIASPTTDEIDLTGDSPEAIAAWIKWYDDLHQSGIASNFAEELEALLAEDKKQELARWDEDSKRIDGIFK